MVERILNWSWILVSSWVCQEGVFKLLAGPRFLDCNIRVYPRESMSHLCTCVEHHSPRKESHVCDSVWQWNRVA